MASTAQVCLPYSGVEKEKKMRSRAVRTQSWCNGKRMVDARNSMARLRQIRRQTYYTNLLRAFDPMERCRADQRSCERRSAGFVFERLTMLDVVWRAKWRIGERCRA